ncbi:MAG: hypothetical protein WDW36_005852 [Sanguina aurantia]
MHQAILLSRRYNESNVRPQTFHIAGVSFLHRQDQVNELFEKQPLMLLREPWNPHDRHAVGVYTLNGTLLGYVPRTNNRRFRREHTPANVVTTGNATPELKGVLVTSRPTLRSLHPQPLPTRHADRYADLATAFPPGVWRGMRERALTKADYKCEVTGVSGEDGPLFVVPSWRYNDAAREVQLAGLSWCVRR